MLIFRDYSDIPEDFRSSVITIGNFDGVHKGHQFIINKVVETSKAIGSMGGVITFHPHPRRVLYSDTKFEKLTFIERKVQLIKELGVDFILLLNFTHGLSCFTPEQFVRDILVNKLKIKLVIVGRNFFFGRDRSGDIATLKFLGERYGFEVEPIDPIVDRDGVVISSSRIRELLKEGKIEEANQMLGRPYELEGKVVKGEGIGKELGFPTVNLKGIRVLIPKRGVYGGYCIIEDRVYKSAIHIGERPTFNKPLSIEAYIIGFSGNLYNKWLRLHILKRIRDQIRFNTIEQLRAQIENDVRRIESEIKIKDIRRER